MPLINGEKVPFDPEHIARAISRGAKVEPDRFDFEDNYQFEQRAQKEYEQISEVLKKIDPRAWRRWHKTPEPENEAPYNEYDKLPGLNPGSLAGNLGVQNTLYSPVQSVPPVPQNTQNAFNQNSLFGKNKPVNWQG